MQYNSPCISYSFQIFYSQNLDYYFIYYLYYKFLYYKKYNIIIIDYFIKIFLLYI